MNSLELGFVQWPNVLTELARLLEAVHRLVSIWHILENCIMKTEYQNKWWFTQGLGQFKDASVATSPIPLSEGALLCVMCTTISHPACSPWPTPLQPLSYSSRTRQPGTKKGSHGGDTSKHQPASNSCKENARLGSKWLTFFHVWINQ